MRSSTQAPELIPWNMLQDRLDGSFAARARGLLRASYTLTDRSGTPFAELRARGGRVTLTAGSLEIEIEGDSRGGYRMLSGGTELARAASPGGSATVLRVECAGQAYEARLRLLSNVTVVHTLDGSEEVSEVARLSGGLAGRRYKAVFDAEVQGALPVAILVLYHSVTLRRRIYLAG
ncbi:MAG TPA: hypothetical protein VFJ72_00830 [Rubrobacteraceae bacterium]|nr:hypothetical protein [Rubrobacteraceae bacterium]